MSLTNSDSDMTAPIGAITQGVDCPLAEARGLGNEAYTTMSFLQRDRERLFAPTWACIGIGNDVPNAGDLKPVELLGIPLLMLRDVSGEIRVFHNVCSHRGVRLVSQSGNVKRVIVCPYHSWSYQLDGRLFGTPHIGGQNKHECAGFDKSRHGLRPVRAAVWFDLVFVNLTDDAPEFENHIAPIAQRWPDRDASQFRHGGADSAWMLDLRCNWKLVIENHNDAYHLPWVHPSLNSYSQFKDHYEIVGDDFYAGQGSTNYNPRHLDGGQSLPIQSGLNDRQQKLAEYIAIFPNAILGVHADHYWSVWLEPVACDRTIERMNIYYVGEESLVDEFARMRAAVRGEWLRIFKEDQNILERMQQGRASPAFTGGVFSPALDAPTHQFHRWAARRL